MNKNKSNVEFLHDMLMKIDLQMDELNETAVRHDEQLKEHMRRSDSNEEAISELRKHSNMALGAYTLLTAISIVAAIYAAVK